MNINSVVEQVRVAFKPHNRLATTCGFILGGFVPSATFCILHWDVAEHPWMWAVAAGGLIFSAKTVYDWGRVAFGNGAKALGFCLLVEGVMSLSSIFYLAAAALGLLVLVNGIATGCVLALNQSAYKQQGKVKGKKKVKETEPLKIAA